MSGRKEEFVYFVNERQAIYTRKQTGPAPWTKDPILATYRFCNVFRELDPVTQYIHQWLKYRGMDALVARATLARYINEPTTLEHIDNGPWNAAVYLRGLQEWRGSGHRVFNPAYIVSTNGIAMDKLEYVVQLVQRVHEEVDIEQGTTLEAAAAQLLRVRGVGSFMAGQIIGDLKHTHLLLNATDWWHWCTPGPGSKRGLNKVRGLPVNTNWRANNFQDAAHMLYTDVVADLVLPAKLDMQNLQNCLCEFDKWCRVKDGTGTPKQKYTPSAHRAH